MIRHFGIAFVVLVGLSELAAHADWTLDEQDVGITTGEDGDRRLKRIDATYAEMPPVKYVPPKDRWSRFPRTAGILAKKEGGELRVVMVGDSICNDTCRSAWAEQLLPRDYPAVKVERVGCFRGGTGCWWFKEPDRVKRYILDHKPDLLVLGGISHKDDIESVRSIVEQVREAAPCDILLMSPVYGTVDPNDDKQWQFKIDLKGKDHRSQLYRLSEKLELGFIDVTAHWGQYVRESGKDLDWFKRDYVHANERGEQVLGRILAAHFAPPLTAKK